MEGCRKINEKQLSTSKCDNIEATKKHRKIRRGKAKTTDDKNNEKEGQSYEAGVFWDLENLFYCKICGILLVLLLKS